MAYKNIQEFIHSLDKIGQLKRINKPVNPVLEITEVADRVMKSGGPALLFEKPAGFDIPVLINALGSQDRMAMALGVQSVEEIAAEITDLMKIEVPEGIIGKLMMLPKYGKLASYAPKTIKSGVCQEVIRKKDASLDELPILQCWPGDGGRFITLPMVFSKDPHLSLIHI